MRKIRTIYLFLVSLNLTSCAFSNYQQSVVSEHKTTLDKKQVCCSSYKDFNYIPMEERYSFLINGEDKTFNFEEGKSFFEAFMIYPPKGRYLLSVTSKRTGGKNIILKKPTLFLPKLILLDENKNIIAKDSELVSSIFSSEYNLSRTYLMNEELGGLVKYIIVYTDPSLTGKIIENPQSMNAYYAGNGQVGFSTAQGTPMALSVEGKMVIKIKQPNRLK